MEASQYDGAHMYYAKFEAHLMKRLSNTEVELKKCCL